MSNMHNIPITIAGILIEVTSPLSAAELGIEGLLGPFLALDEPEKPQDRVALRWEESENMPAPCGELIFDPGSLWRIYRAGKEYYAAICYPGGRQCVLRANATWDEVTLTEQRSGLNWQSLLNTSAGELLLHTRILLPMAWSSMPPALTITVAALSLSDIPARARAHRQTFGNKYLAHL
jgi:hypothetical protein